VCARWLQQLRSSGACQKKMQHHLGSGWGGAEIARSRPLQAASRFSVWRPGTRVGPPQPWFSRRVLDHYCLSRGSRAHRCDGFHSRRLEVLLHSHHDTTSAKRIHTPVHTLSIGQSIQMPGRPRPLHNGHRQHQGHELPRHETHADCQSDSPHAPHNRPLSRGSLPPADPGSGHSRGEGSLQDD
jgi:hypothetical protein